VGAERPEPSPRVRTWVIWVVLTLLALAGMACGIAGAVAFASVLGGGVIVLMLPLGVLGSVGFVFFLYLTLGVVYRLDRLRNPLSRRIRLFE
jgi:hypothetical protein